MKPFQVSLPLPGLLLFCALHGVFGGTISGSVTENSLSGGALQNVLLILTSTQSTRISIDSTTSDAQGRYTFSAVARGQYLIVALKAGYRQQEMNWATVSASGVQTVNIVLTTLTDTISIKGTLKNADKNGAAIGGALLVLQQRVQQGLLQVWTSIDSTTSTGKGLFSFDSLGDGSYRIIGSAPGFVTVTSAAINLGGQSVTFDITMIAKPARASVPVAARKQGVAISVSCYGLDGSLLNNRQFAASPAYGALLPRARGTKGIVVVKTVQDGRATCFIANQK
ncbi:MAG: carboxypeptidase-like regulatory domain-containing protein [Chitinivibrionales bacterium]|nr:carboxypeptidase-like regulatory domain-containing protein [Chitinivibrionales bacterium]